jgi:hypothetical protein
LKVRNNTRFISKTEAELQKCWSETCVPVFLDTEGQRFNSSRAPPVNSLRRADSDRFEESIVETAITSPRVAGL